MLNVTASLAPTGGQRCYCYVRLDEYLHGTGKWCENGHRNSHARADDSLTPRKYAYNDQQW
jgi:hypothetical protein